MGDGMAFDFVDTSRSCRQKGPAKNSGALGEEPCQGRLHAEGRETVRPLRTESVSRGWGGGHGPLRQKGLGFGRTRSGGEAQVWYR